MLLVPFKYYCLVQNLNTEITRGGCFESKANLRPFDNGKPLGFRKTIIINFGAVDLRTELEAAEAQ